METPHNPFGSFKLHKNGISASKQLWSQKSLFWGPNPHFSIFFFTESGCEGCNHCCYAKFGEKSVYFG